MPYSSVLPSTPNTLILSETTSQFIQTLYQGAQQQSVEDFKSWSLEQLQQLCPFECALWGCQSEIQQPLLLKHLDDICLYNLPADFVRHHQKTVERSGGSDPLDQIIDGQSGQINLLRPENEPISQWHQSCLYQHYLQPFAIEQGLMIYS